MRVKWFFILLLAALTCTNAVAETFAPVGTIVGQFLEIGMGARAAAMGEAYTTSASGAGAVFWNPAGLVEGGRKQLFVSQTQWPAGMAFGGAAFSVASENSGTFAVSAVYLMTDDMEITTLDYPTGTGEYFSLTNYAMGLSYARYLTDRVSIGLTLKMIGEKYLDKGYDTWSLDLGSVYRTNFKGLKLGMSVMNFGPEVTFSGKFIDYSDQSSYLPDPKVPKSFEAHSLPVMFRFGTSMNILEGSSYRLTAAADMVHPNNNLEQYNVGCELALKDIFYFRSGYKLTADEGGYSVGAGLKMNLMDWTKLIVDYAYSDLGVLTNSHRFSLVISF